MRTYADVVWSPFEIIYLILTATVQSIKESDYIIKFNLMDTANTFTKLSYTEEDTIEIYNLAQNLM